MGESRQTPGPWRYEQTPLPQVWSESVIESGSNLEKRRIHIADVRGWGALQYREDGEEMQDANGRLIAAAPELYEALYDLLTYAQEDEAFCDRAGDPGRYATKVLAEDAIRKAEGG